MANPRQRRKAKSGTNKVRQSRRQQDKLKKIIVQGPPSLVKQWDVRKTARQNYDTLGLSLKRPLALRQSGGTEKHDEDLTLFGGKMDEDAADDANDESSEEDEDEDDENAANEAAAARPPSNTTSRDIPKGFARIERDAQGNVIRVVMSAFDEDDEDEQAQDGGEGTQQQQQVDTPWGEPLNREEDARRTAAPIQPVIAKNAAIRELEAAAEEEAKNKAPRFSSNGEADVLARLVRKYGDDIGAMSRDIKLNRDQRTVGQLRKAIARAGGIDKLKQVEV